MVKKKLKTNLLARVKPYILTYLVSIAVPLLVGLLSTALTKDNMSIYRELPKPPLAPPAALFPIVWTVLYILMGVSSATTLVTKTEENEKYVRAGLEYYIVSLIFNFGWSIIFFNLSSYFIALVWLFVLLYTVIKTVLCYRKVSPISAYLQLPYIAWLVFAAYLNGFYALFA